MTTPELLAELERQDIHLSIEGSKLRLNAPKGGLTPSLRAEVERRKEEILALLTASAPAVFEVRPLQPTRMDGPLPLSFGQERLWFLDRLDPGQAVYNVPLCIRLSGRLDLGSLKASLREILRRHDALRTRFVEIDGRPLQAVSQPGPFPLHLTDLGSLPDVEREDEMTRLVMEEGLRPFDLARGPLIRAQCLRLAENDHLLLVTMHHIISDGWSSGVFLREVGALYEAFAAGRPSPLPDLPLQYPSFAQWQREWLQGPVLEHHLSYWRGRLEGAPLALELPTDRPRPTAQSFRGTQRRCPLTAPLSQALKGLARREGVTLYMTLLAAFQALLHRYTGQEDIVVGSPVAARNRAEVEGLIGFFVNTLVLRTDLSGDPSFRELLGRVREVALGAYAHQDLPFEKLVVELRPERQLSRNPVFQVLFNMVSFAEEIRLPDLTATLLTSSEFVGESYEVPAQFDLSLHVREGQDGITLRAVFATDLFDPPTIARLLGHYETLLQEVVADPDRRLSALPLLTERERREILVDWISTETPYPRAACVHHLVQAQVDRTPTAAAVEFEGTRLSYRDLNRGANHVARRLRALGVGPDVRVGLCLERSIEAVVAILGVLKADGAYVPLDPAYPQERLAYMLSDAQIAVVITQRHLADAIAVPNIPTLCLGEDECRVAITDVEGANLDSRATNENLAYVIYTSGSTGKPKGVAMPHRPLVNLLTWQQSATTVSRGARTLQFASLSFDVSFQEIFSTWCSGGTLVLVSEEMRRDAWQLLHYLDEARVERVFLPPAALHMVAQATANASGPLPPIREMITAGEQLRITPEIAALFTRFRGATLHNQYGPTETHVVSQFTLTGAPATWPALPPIGRPIPNARLYVLDARSQPVPVGVAGELYIGGDALARGYLDQPEFTAARFIQDPFDRDPRARLYRTGDRVRYRADGQLEFQGRLDQQVKIRGFRVEPGEIEAVLGQQPAVREALVMVREDAPGEKRLIAYVVAREGSGAGPDGLRAALREQLPDYMVPAAFVLLDAFPLNPNGKVDRRGLPAPEPSDMGAGDQNERPRTPVEEAVAAIWAQVLGLDQVGIHTSFFDLGGHSLLATQLISRIREVFRVDLPLRALFEGPTIASLAAAIEAALRMGSEAAAPPIRPAPPLEEPPLSLAQERLWFLDRWEAGSATYNMPVAWRLQGALDVGALEGALTEIVRRHEVLRTTFPSRDGRAFQAITPPHPIPLTVHDLRGAEDRDVAAVRLTSEEAGRPFDLSSGPVFRATLIRLTDDEHVLLVNMHHIVSDGWSLNVLARELGVLYTAFRQGSAPALPPLAIQYADYASWQRSWLQGQVLADQVAYWKDRLGGAPAVLELPTDHPRPAVQRFRGDRVSEVLPRPLTEGLRRLSRREGVTPFMTLLAGFAVLLSRYTGQEDIVVGSPIAGRTRVETEGLVGFFVNTLCLRMNLAGNPTVRELLGRVRDVALGAYTHQELPFERLVEELHPERNPSYTPLFQVLFNMAEEGGEGLRLSGLAVTPEPLLDRTAKFDLTLSLVAGADGLTAFLRYNRDLFDPPTIARMVGHYREVLEGIVATPDARLADLPLLTAAERDQLLAEWSGRVAPYPREISIAALFQVQVAATPDAAALTWEGGAMAYRDLNARANRLAHRLRALGVGPEVLVGLCLERSPELLIALLGILKAGGAYLPLDPEYPPERLRFMLRDATPAVLLTTEGLADRLSPGSTPVLRLDADADALAGESPLDPPCSAMGHSLAYVIYTSGSTGVPKGTAISQRGVVRLVKGTDYVRFGPDEVFLQLAPISFDASTFEIWGALLNGARLVIFPPGPVSLENLGAALRRHGVTTLWLTAGLFHQMVDARVEDLRGLRQLLAGGDVLSPAHVRKALAAGVRCLINGYGPTESTTFTCTHTLTDPNAVDGPIPIGRPIPNTRVYVLDAHDRPVPIGVPGELYIGGDGLARGYLNRPELTAVCFVPDPFSPDASARLYRTGDLVRFRPDGTLDFLGRNDFQVKIRGFRVELGEVEAALARHPGLREAVVITRPDPVGDKRLVAYVVPAAPPGPPAAELRTFLRAMLPEYMIPAAAVVLDRLPLNSNGKVDRAMLSEAEASLPSDAVAFVPPDTELERIIAAAWREVLKLDIVGVHDNFFDLGGHSLLMVQLHERLQKAAVGEITMVDLFRCPTVHSLAAWLGRDRDATRRESLDAVRERAAKQRDVLRRRPSRTAPARTRHD